MTTVLINLIPIKSGGGQQVALNFLNVLLQWDLNTNFFFVATASTDIANVLKDQNRFPFEIVKRGLLNRLVFEKILVNRIIKREKIAIVYTLFGPSILNSKTINICGCAYSNLFFPEVDFWKLPIHWKLIKNIKDRLRLQKIINSDAVIFENEAIEKRAKELFHIENSISIKPSILFSPNNLTERGQKQINRIDEAKYNILMLTGWHSNKNLHLIPQILKTFKRNNIENINIVISVEERDLNTAKLVQTMQDDGTIHLINIIGTVNSSDVKFLAENVDAFMLLSNLESFSNNIIEAWYYKKPLIISDKDWSRSICGEAANYVDLSDPEKIGTEIIQFVNNHELHESLVEKGTMELAKYPKPKQKVIQQIEYLKAVYEESLL